MGRFFSLIYYYVDTSTKNSKQAFQGKTFEFSDSSSMLELASVCSYCEISTLGSVFQAQISVFDEISVARYLNSVRATVVRRLVSVLREVCYFYSRAVLPIKSDLF